VSKLINQHLLRDLETGCEDRAAIYGIVAQAIVCANLQMTQGTTTDDFVEAMGLLQALLRRAST
jgi:hypothetical protein